MDCGVKLEVSHEHSNHVVFFRTNFVSNSLLFLAEYVLCISTSFWVLRAPKSWPTFIVHFKAFLVISWLKSTKNMKVFFWGF